MKEFVVTASTLFLFRVLTNTDTGVQNASYLKGEDSFSMPIELYNDLKSGEVGSVEFELLPENMKGTEWIRGTEKGTRMRNNWKPKAVDSLAALKFKANKAQIELQIAGNNLAGKKLELEGLDIERMKAELQTKLAAL